MTVFDIPRVKICCIQSVEEAHTAINAGASLLGLVSEMPSGPGVIPEETITEIAKTVPPGVTTVLLTSEIMAEAIIEQQKRTGVNALQLVDRVHALERQKIKSELPGISILQVVHVIDESSVEEALEVSESCDAILLDSGSFAGDVKILGGTGTTHDWSLSRKIVQKVPVPVFLAGGLNPDNVAEAVKYVQPYSLDICSGVRTAFRLDEQKLRVFMENRLKR